MGMSERGRFSQSAVIGWLTGKSRNNEIFATVHRTGAETRATELLHAHQIGSISAGQQNFSIPKPRDFELGHGKSGSIHPSEWMLREQLRVAAVQRQFTVG